jgi:hypothetical protein
VRTISSNQIIFLARHAYATSLNLGGTSEFLNAERMLEFSVAYTYGPMQCSY